MWSNDKLESNSEEISEISEFYKGCNVLITGGSGFIGKLLIEKLLRSFRISKLYLILRAKKGKSPNERLNALFEDPLYDRLKLEQPHFDNKIVMVEGEFNSSGLTLSAENRDLIKDSHIIFHGAATVRFDGKLRFTIDINVRGTKKILLFSRQMSNLKAFIYISTAFSHCVNKFIDEVFYEPAIDCDKILALLDLLNDDQLAALIPTLLDKWPNVYAFSKSIAESVVLKYSNNLPVIVVRPSIVTGTKKDPIPGWTDNLYGMTGVYVAATMGLLHSLYCNIYYAAEIIPGDYVINNIIASAWDIGTTQKAESKKIPTPFLKKKKYDIEEKPRIYNIVTSNRNSVLWGQCKHYAFKYGSNIPYMQTMFVPFVFTSKYLWLHKINIFVFHTVFALIFDTSLRIRGQKPIVLATYNKVNKFITVISYFTTQEWNFRNDNVCKLWNKMSMLDRNIFYFDITGINWAEYHYHYLRGIRLFVMKEPWSNLKESKKRFIKIVTLRISIVAIVLLLLLGLIYIVFSTLYSYIFI